MDKCIFCRIRDGEEGNAVFYRDEVCFVVADKYPLSKGHMLIISNKHYRDVTEVPDEEVSHMFIKARDLSKSVMEKLGAEGANIGVNTGKAAGQVIFHFHIHVVPRYLKGGNLEGSFWNRMGKELSAREAEELYALLSKK